jgi:hypothetical protein
MPADAWFDFKGSDRFEVTEQSFLLPNEEILTILICPTPPSPEPSRGPVTTKRLLDQAWNLPKERKTEWRCQEFTVLKAVLFSR